MVAWDSALLYGGFMTSLILLGFKSHITLWSLIISRICIKGANAPASEDRKAFRMPKKQEETELKSDEGFVHPDVRINAILVNENQGFTFFLLFALAFMAMTEMSRGKIFYSVNAVVGPVLFMLYVLCRYIWFFLYMAKLQPWRTIAFALSTFVQSIIGLYTIVAFIVSVAIY